MPTFTVHEPPPRNGESAADPQRFVFIRDGFHFWAFVLAPLWLLAHRLWLAFVAYFVLSVGLGIGFALLDAPKSVRLVIALLAGALIGMEAASIRRWTLARRKWKTVGVIVAEDEELAERRFFAQWLERRDAPAQPPAPLVMPAVPRAPRPGNDVIGLFPEPRS